MKTSLIQSKNITCAIVDTARSTRKLYHKNRFHQYLTSALISLEKFLLKEIPSKNIFKGQNMTVEVMLCGKKRIYGLNKLHRSKDKVTDVLSFPQYENLRKGLQKHEFTYGEISLGDIAICKEVAQAQAKRLGHSMEKEMSALFIHGFFHLLGYDHEISQKEEKLMFSLEDKITNSMKWDKE